MSKPAFYNGILYQIEYQPQLSNSDYTQHKVYHIKTEDENYPHARKAEELDVYVYTFVRPYDD